MGDVNHRHAAASYGHLELLEYLISKGGDINIADEDGETPIFTVESVEVARWLVEHGANVDVQNNEGQSASPNSSSHSRFLASDSSSSFVHFSTARRVPLRRTPRDSRVPPVSATRYRRHSRTAQHPPRRQRRRFGSTVRIPDRATLFADIRRPDGTDQRDHGATRAERDRPGSRTEGDCQSGRTARVARSPERTSSGAGRRGRDGATGGGRPARQQEGTDGLGKKSLPNLRFILNLTVFYLDPHNMHSRKRLERFNVGPNEWHSHSRIYRVVYSVVV
jgi:hypothetical protein